MQNLFSCQSVTNPEKDLDKQVDKTLDALRTIYNGRKDLFDFNASQFLSGDENKNLRIAIVTKLTGQRQPASKCGYFATMDVIRESFNQLKLF